MKRIVIALLFAALAVAFTPSAEARPRLPRKALKGIAKLVLPCR